MSETATAAVSAEDVIRIKTQLEGDGSQRHSHYNDMLDASHGNYWDRVVQETWRRWEGIIYEPGYQSQDRRQVHIIVNLLPQIIEAKRALWSVMPQIRVPYRSLDDADVAMSDLLERSYRALWSWNRMGEKLGDGGWYAALLGTCVFAVYPDFVEHKPRVVVRSPYGFYGVPGNIEQDGSVWERVLFTTRMRGRQAKLMWPDVPGINDSGDSVTVIEYWDRETKMTVLEQGAVVLDGPVPNKLGKVPVVTVPNIAQPGQWWGKGDGDDAVPAINELNKRFNVENQAFSDQAGAPWEAIDLDMDEGDVSLDPDAINRFRSGGGLKKSQTGGLPWQIYQSNAQLRQYVDALTDFPEVMRSMFGGSNVSGKAINNLMGPIQARMELRQRYLYPRLEILNKLMMETWATYWGGEEHVLRGSEKGRRYNFEIRPDDFEGYWENEVFLDSTSYFDVQSKIVLGLQMVAANGLSIKSFVQKMNPVVDDWEGEHEQIMKEQQERIQLAMMAQMMTMNPMGANPDVGQPMQSNKSLSIGSETSAEVLPPPPGVTEDMMQMGGEQFFSGQTPFEAAPLPAGGREQLVLVADLIRETPKVTGRVFLAGSIVSEGRPGPEGIEIWFTDMVDWATVRQYVTKAEPELAGQFNPMQGVPSTTYLEVTPGTSGYTPQPAEGLAEEGLMAQPPMDASTMAGSGGPAMMPPPELLGGI